jgi:hypothetical protein
MPRTLNRSRPTGSVVDRSPEIQGDALLRELVGDVGGVTQRAGKTVELRDHEDVAGAACSQGLTEAGPCSSGAR